MNLPSRIFLLFILGFVSSENDVDVGVKVNVNENSKKPNPKPPIVCRAGTVPVTDIGCISLNTTKRSWDDSMDFCSSQGMRGAEGIKRSDIEPIFKKLVESEVTGEHKTFVRIWIWIGATGRKYMETGKWINPDAYSINEPGGDATRCIALKYTADHEGGSDDGAGDYPCHKEYATLCQYFPAIPS